MFIVSVFTGEFCVVIIYMFTEVFLKGLVCVVIKFLSLVFFDMNGLCCHCLYVY
jgi:hypothetical protein